MARSKKDKAGTPEIHNRRARHDYILEETMEVGIALTGSEVKSIRDGKASIAEAYVRAQSSPLRLDIHGMHIHEYPPATGNNHIPTRTRKLLAHKREMEKLARASEQKGVTIVPLRLYFKNGWAKLEIATARGKAHHDKRQDIKKRDVDRDIRRALSKKI